MHTSGYMSLNRQKEKEEESEYQVGNTKGKRLLGSVTKRFSTLTSTSSKFGTTKWSLMLVVTSLCVALAAILLSIVALGLSTKCGTCPQLRDDLSALQAQLRATNCTYELVASCTFSSGPSSDLQAFCETLPVRVREATPVVRSWGGVVTGGISRGFLHSYPIEPPK